MSESKVVVLEKGKTVRISSSLVFQNSNSRRRRRLWKFEVTFRDNREPYVVETYKPWGYDRVRMMLECEFTSSENTRRKSAFDSDIDRFERTLARMLKI